MGFSLHNVLNDILGHHSAPAPQLAPNDPGRQGYPPDFTYNPNQNTAIPYSSHNQAIPLAMQHPNGLSDLLRLLMPQGQAVNPQASDGFQRLPDGRALVNGHLFPIGTQEDNPNLPNMMPYQNTTRLGNLIEGF